ncbi:lysosomal dipeptide transporter MFSD1-like [Nelusetta ayraudi]|uniref:lysosomal dipeptide transporter MFSD1-like n=1 Tax=Nelusetta ayraudi TaxID=303726 RepID=UPI003F713A2D
MYNLLSSISFLSTLRCSLITLVITYLYTYFTAYYRFLVLFFNCLLSFGSYFSYDIPSVLQAQFQGNLTCPSATATNGSGDCVLGLGMSPQQYNSLFAIGSWMSAVLLMPSGLLIDKFGNSCGTFLFSFMCIVGSSLFALGAHFKGAPCMLPLMLFGRLLFGSASQSLAVVQDCITATWFKNKELGLAFGLTLGFTRLGSVLNFFTTSIFQEKYGLQWTLWGGVLLCVFGFIIAMIVSTLDSVKMRQQGPSGVIQETSGKMKIQDLTLLSIRYWLLTFTITFFYNNIIPFLVNASQFFENKYGESYQGEGAYLSGSVYDCSLVLTTLIGLLLDCTGLRGIFMFICCVLTLPVFGLLAFTYVPPLVSTIWLGVSYSAFAMCSWPSIAMVVPQSTLGTALALTLSISTAGNGVCNLVIGWILGTTSSAAKIPLWRWQGMLIFLLANVVCANITSVLLNIVDYRQGWTLNKAKENLYQGERDSDQESLNKAENLKNRDVKSYSSCS